MLSHDMKDGDVGVITAWGENSHYIGRVVQRYGKSLVAIGMGTSGGWFDWFQMTERQEACRVRLLQPGDVLEVA
jgi:hypothetical protein